MKQPMEITILPPAVRQEARHLVPARAMKLVSDLPERTQAKILEESQLALAARTQHVRAGLAFAQHLSNLHDILGKDKLFYRYVGRLARVNPRTAYRYITGWRYVRDHFPEAIVRALSTRDDIRLFGTDPKKPLGPYTDAVRLLGPAPRNADPEVAHKYLDDLRRMTKERRSRLAKHNKKTGSNGDALAGTGDPQLALAEAYQFVSSRMKKLPTAHKERKQWLDSLTEYLYAKLGVSNAVTVKPSVAPQEFEPRAVGRPSQKQAAQ